MADPDATAGRVEIDGVDVTAMVDPRYWAMAQTQKTAQARADALRAITAALSGALSEDDTPVHPATLQRAARAILGALAGAGRLRVDDSGVEVQLCAELAYTRERFDVGPPTTNRDWWLGGRHALERLAGRLGIELD